MSHDVGCDRPTERGCSWDKALWPVLLGVMEMSILKTIGYFASEIC